MKKISIVIPTIGKDILAKSLPVVIKNSPGCQIVIVDDGSADDTSQFLAKKYPEVLLITNPTNLGFTESVNRGVAAASGEFIVLLNNDVYPEKHYLDKALPFFGQESVCAVTFNEEHSSWPLTTWHGGKLQYVQASDKSKAVYSTWASGGSCIFRASAWQSLAGFNPIYSPGYWEDIDLGWRAWASGFKIIWAPEAHVIHRHESSFKKLDQSWLNQIKQRNELLFTWQNITSPKLIISHLFFLARHSLFHPGYLRVICLALMKIPFVRYLKKRVRTDSEILALVNKTVE